MNSKVTVFTPVYNGISFLKETIESTLNQTYADFEYLIIDDCSTDDSASLIKSYNDPRINFVQNEKNIGVAKTFNKGLSIINSKYVIRIDQDDVNFSNRVESQINFLELNEHIDITCTWEQSIDHNGNKIRNWKRKISNYGEFLGPVLLGICPIWHPSIAFKKQSMIDAGGFDPLYTRAEDFEVTARMAIKRLNAAIVPEFLVFQREHNQRQSIEYNSIQEEVKNKIHLESLNYFLKDDLMEDFASFIRIEKNLKNKPNKNNLVQYSKLLHRLFEEVSKKQNLSSDEKQSLINTFSKRLGYGIILCHRFSFLPKLVFHLIFKILSPLSNPYFRSKISFAYNYIKSFRLFKKKMTGASNK